MNAVETMKATLAAWITAERKRRGLTQEKMSEMAGLDTRYISRIENGKLERFSLDRLIMVLWMLGCAVEIQVVQRFKEEDHATAHHASNGPDRPHQG